MEKPTPIILGRKMLKPLSPIGMRGAEKSEIQNIFRRVGGWAGNLGNNSFATNGGWGVQFNWLFTYITSNMYSLFTYLVVYISQNTYSLFTLMVVYISHKTCCHWLAFFLCC